MKLFHILQPTVMYVFVLPACYTNDAKSAASTGLSHDILQEFKEKLKISRIKRTLDICERLIRGYKNKKEDSCISIGDSTPICDEVDCPYKPSYPPSIHPVFYYNKTTKKLDLKVTWNKPRFGINNLCGFQIHYSILYPNIRSGCLQLNLKSLFAYTFYGVPYNAKFNITIVSLPADKNQDVSSRFITVHSPDKCKALREFNESLPWECKLTKNFPVVCEDGRINVTLEKPSNIEVDENYSMVVIYNSQHQLPVNESSHSKGQQFIVYTGLKSDIKYSLQVGYIKDNVHILVSSQPFTCTDQQHPISTVTSSPAPTLLFILLPVAIVILVTIAVCIKCKLTDVIKNMWTTQTRQDDAQKPDDTPLPEGQRALLIYPFGCEDLNNLVLLLGQLLDSMGCQCILDLVMYEQVLEERDREIFLMRRLDEAQKDDCIIFFNYKETNRQSQNALKCHHEEVNRKVLQDLRFKQNLVSICFDLKEKLKHAINLNFAGDASKELKKLVRIIWKIPRYKFGWRLPQENTVELDSRLEKQIILNTKSLMASVHDSCYKGLCNKGQKDGCSNQMQVPVLNGNLTSSNSFVSLKLTDNDVADHQHVNLSHLSSSEPLLTAIKL